VNAVSIPASLLAVLAVVSALPACARFLRRAEPDHETSVTCLLLLLVIGAFAGYFWLLVSYPAPSKGNTIKATYMLHTFPFVAVLVGCLLERLRDTSPRLPLVAAAILVATFLHNLPAMLTRFIAL
jgi:drug/metabolite transporter (DMT)-like permease